MSSVALFSLLLLLACMVGRSVQVCAPDCTSVTPETPIPDPTDCTRYYVCIDINGEMIPSDLPIDCPDGQYFNSDLSVPGCDPINTAPAGFCTDLCNPCAIDCREDNPGSVHPDPINCNQFFVCVEGGSTLTEYCPVEAPYFDFLTKNCQTDETLCYYYCDPCVPHCTYDGEKVPDPYDCHHFYFCSPPDMASFLCPSGGVFDPVTMECGSFACNTACVRRI